MTKIGLIRCQKNETRCPLTGCINSLKNCEQGFSSHAETELCGVFTCQCPGDGLVDMAKIMKSKGCDTLHFCTCTFAHKESGKWQLGQGFCDHIDALMERVSKEAEITCIKGSAHLPEGYRPEVYTK